MPGTKKIPLFWWSEPRLMGKDKDNYGDLLSKYLVEKISGRPVKWVQPKMQAWYKLNKTNYLAVGSILHQANKHSIVWGSGIIDHKQQIAKADFRAVRGPETRKFLIQKGYNCPEVYGDPAILLPYYFNPKIDKEYKYGVVPHYTDYHKIKEMYHDDRTVHVIDLMTTDIEKTTVEILKCKKIVSTSLHGGIVAHAYGIPAVFAYYQDNLFGDGVKYKDYLKSVEIKPYKLPKIGEDLSLLLEAFPASINTKKLNDLQTKLLKACPFLLPE